MTRLGVIGGSGLYDLPGLTDVEEVAVTTPFGAPSDRLLTGRLGEVELVFLPRHGRGHRYLPTEVPYRANLWALRSLGCRWVLSVSAVGSLEEAVAPGDLVVVDQFIDRTRQRPSTFFGDGLVAHVSFGDPVCPVLRGLVLEAARTSDKTVHDGGTYVCMEGPAFSTRAESQLYRSWGCRVVGMTNLPEAKLAREAEMSYATLALSTDYDCWFEGHDEVNADAVGAVVRSNVAAARQVIVELARRVGAYDGPQPAAWSALSHAIMTDPAAIPQATRERLDLLVGAYLRD